MKNKSWYKIDAKANANPEVLIYGDIGDYDVSEKQFRADLYSVDAGEINLRISSRGGSVFAGVAIYNMIKDHPAKITAYVDSLAASISAFIPMAADRVVMAANSRMMIHKAWGMVVGNADELSKTVDALNDVDTIQAKAFSERTGIAESKILAMLAAETWMNPTQAKEMGFIDEITGESETKAQFDLSPFAKVPDDIAALYGVNGSTDREIEQLLRDAGVSRKNAMAAVAAIKGESQRDSDRTGEAGRELLAKIEIANLLTKLKGA